MRGGEVGRMRCVVASFALLGASAAFLTPQMAPAGRGGPQLIGLQMVQPKCLRRMVPQMLSVETSSSRVVACSQRPATKDGGIGQYMSELTAAELATSLESRLGHLLSAKPSEENPGSVVVSLRDSVWFGPEILSLWIKPRLVIQLHHYTDPSPGIEVTSKDEQDADFSERLRLAQLELNCWCTWVEDSIQHLQGNTVPCLLLKTQLRLHVQQVKREGSSWLLRAMPNQLLMYFGRRALTRKLAALEDAVAGALVGGYEEWSVRRAVPYLDDFYDFCP